MTEPLLSIVVGTVDRPDHIHRLIESIQLHTKIPYELIITDASQNPISIPPHDKIRVIREWPRIGHSKGYNRGFKATRAKWVCWLNDDAIVTENWASAAVTFMETNPWCGLGALYYMEHGCCWHINQYQGMIYANFGIISKTLGDMVGWFDEYLHCYGADNSIAFKVVLAGFGLAGIPGSRVKHTPIMDNNKEFNLSLQAQDAARLMEKYRPMVDHMLKLYREFPKSQLTVR